MTETVFLAEYGGLPMGHGRSSDAALDSAIANGADPEELQVGVAHPSLSGCASSDPGPVICVRGFVIRDQRVSPDASHIAWLANQMGLSRTGLVELLESGAVDGAGACEYDEDGVQLFLGKDNEHQPILRRDTVGWVVAF